MSDSSETDAKRRKVARSILKNNLAVKSGERVIVEGWSRTLPWAVALAHEARALGASPIILYNDEPSFWETVEKGGAKTLGVVPKHEWAAMQNANVYIHMFGPHDRVRLNGLPEKVQNDIFAFNMRWYELARKWKLRGARLDLGRPSADLAKVYGVDEDAWMDQLVNAALVNPKEMARRGQAIAKALRGGSRLRIRHDNGTDLTLGLLKRPVRVYSGEVPPLAERGQFDMLANVPTGIVSVALDERVADGTIVANRPNYFDDGMATGATLHFSGGRMTEMSFDSGAERFEVPYKKAGKGRDQPGMLRIGLNPALMSTPQLEDVEKGAVMVSVGGNRNLGGKNSAAYFGFAIAAGAEVEVDGKPVRM